MVEVEAFRFFFLSFLQAMPFIADVDEKRTLQYNDKMEVIKTSYCCLYNFRYTREGRSFIVFIVS